MTLSLSNVLCFCTRFRSVYAKQIDLLILASSMAHVGSSLRQEVSDVSIPVEKAASRVRAEPRLVRVQCDGVGKLQAAQLVAKVGADVRLQEGHGVCSSHHSRPLLSRLGPSPSGLFPRSVFLDNATCKVAAPSTVYVNVKGKSSLLKIIPNV